ncbi:MAG: DUF86 domain-containing protein [Hormoscilla sp. GUM202]|nr:DUF86 domain-containing protein [Hormoscilla sp. GUM202]
MKRDEALTILTTHAEEIQNYGVKSLAMFGSVARNEGRPDSDLDLLVEWESGKRIGWSDFVEIQQYLENILACQVDLVVPKELKPRLRDRILREALPVLPVTSQKVVTQEVAYNMPRKDWKIYIEDILGSITDIQSFAVDFDFETFITDKRTVNAVLHSFMIIGEAARKITPEVETRYSQITWPQMRGMRNRIVHEYRDVDLEKVWDIIQNELLPLVPQLQSLLDEPD